LGGRSEQESELYVQALARGLAILALFDVEHPEWNLNDICERTGISKTTAYRMLRTLEWTDFVVFDPDTERYRLGRAMIPGAYLTLSYVSFVRSAHPFLEDLAKTTGETVELTVEAAQGAVVVDQVATSHPFKPNLPTGRILGNMANSAVRMYVAMRPAEERARLLRSRISSSRPIRSIRKSCAVMLSKAEGEIGVRPGRTRPRGLRSLGSGHDPRGRRAGGPYRRGAVRSLRSGSSSEERGGRQGQGGGDDSLLPPYVGRLSLTQRFD
jgi:hypothetical protein